MVVFFMLAVCRKLCLVGFFACVCTGSTLLATQSAPMVRLAYGVPLDLVGTSKVFWTQCCKGETRARMWLGMLVSVQIC